MSRRRRSRVASRPVLWLLFVLLLGSLLAGGNGHRGVALLLVLAVVLLVRPIRSALRFTAAYAGLWLVYRAVLYVARRRGELPAPGRVGDPRAPWRRYLERSL